MLLLLLALLFSERLMDVNCSPLPEAAEALREDGFIKAVHYVESNPETREELMSNNYALSEGDMLLSSDRNVVGRSWPTLNISYVISSTLASRTKDILAAMAMISKQTCVTFHKRTTERNYLVFEISRGCASYVGFNGGAQPLFVAPQCNVGNIVHEILHALGFHHEHTRMDREQYITILSRNIMPGMERNFAKHRGKTFQLPYDITSILHYGSTFFTTNGEPTIIARKAVVGMGQRVKMTETDVQRVNLLYNCGSLKHQAKQSAADELQGKDQHGNETTRGNQTTTPPPASLQHLTTTTRGPSNTTNTSTPQGSTVHH